MCEEGVPSLGERGLAVGGYKLAVCHPSRWRERSFVSASRFRGCFALSYHPSSQSIYPFNQSVSHSLPSACHTYSTTRPRYISNPISLHRVARFQTELATRYRPGTNYSWGRPISHDSLRNIISTTPYGLALNLDYIILNATPNLSPTATNPAYLN